MNGMRLTFDNEEAYQLIVEVARGQYDEVAAIASVLRSNTEVR